MTSRVSPVLAWLGLRRPAALFTYAKTHFLGILLFSTGFAPGSNLLALLNIVAIAAWAAQLWERASWADTDMIRQKLGDLIRRNSGTGQTLLALAHKVLQEEGKENSLSAESGSYLSVGLSLERLPGFWGTRKLGELRGASPHGECADLRLPQNSPRPEWVTVPCT